MTKNNVLNIALTMTLFSCLNIEKAELKSSNAFTAETSKKKLKIIYKVKSILPLKKPI